MEENQPYSLPQLPIFQYSGFREFSPNEYHINQTLPVHVLIFMSSGTLHFREDGVDITLQKDEYHIQKADSVLEGIRPSIQPKYFYLCFTDPTLSDTFQGIPLQGKCPYDLMRSEIDKLHLAYLSVDRDPVVEAAHFYRIITALKSRLSAPPKTVVARVTAQLQKNFKSSTNLEDVAKETGYSINYLIREFHAFHGMTPHQYVLRLRIENAKALLTSSNATLPEVATLSGFRDPTSMHRSFIKKVGESPGQYRKKHTPTGR